MMSTPRSCIQKKSSVYKSSISSSSLDKGISIDSLIRLKETIVPLTHCTKIAINRYKPIKLTDLALGVYKFTKNNLVISTKNNLILLKNIP